MAEDGSWPSIEKHGLLSTTALLNLYQINGAQRQAIESQRRPQSVTIGCQGLPDVVVRDQKPLWEGPLAKCLEDNLTPTQWYEILNAKTFFWLSPVRLWRLLNAKAYRSQPQTVLTIETATLVAAHRDKILLSPINSGSTIMGARPRGNKTFLPISDYPYAERRKTRPKADALVELIVTGGVSDIAKHVIAVHRIHNIQPVQIWRRPGTDPHDGPEL
ncbi:hypothetical protein EOB36_00715 [Mesorhizobium sp. M6A.T.Cr.TU.017.01.1.1]|nr:hypothetical protein EOB36_00715 [Mesorhizobium sp. M6A.T.Cr.TU.017.01.1.1]